MVKCRCRRKVGHVAIDRLWPLSFMTFRAINTLDVFSSCSFSNNLAGPRREIVSGPKGILRQGRLQVRNTKLLIAGIAALFAASSFQAVAYIKPTAKPGIESSVELTAGKKKSKKKVAKKASKKSKATKVAALTKSCGTFMYRKDGKCVDARAKK